jgi:SAM-dependent methyltransferase
MSVRISIDLKLDLSAAFETFVEELSTALSRLGMQLESGVDGCVMEGPIEVARVECWQPRKQILLEWHRADWQPNEVTKFELRFEPIDEGSRITLEHQEWSNLLGDRGSELAGWFAGEVAAPLLRAMGPSRLGDWITDRRARCPSGQQARATYRDPLYHRPNFKAILEVLALRPDDYLLEVGCGGGAFLEEALRSGCKAAAIDHSSDMVSLARDVNRVSIRENRLEISQGKADSLPYPDGIYTCAVMTGVLGFISDPLKAFSEVRRVLADGGRFVLFTGSKELLGTPAAPEPIASRLHFYEDQELEELARKAGFDNAHVEQPDFEQFAREVGVPGQHIELFKGRGGGQLLLARKT